MRIEFLHSLEKKLKSAIFRCRLKNHQFTIISNNCWGTFIYKKFGLPYQSPFVNLLIFAPDYIDLLENFSQNILRNITFISNKESKFVEELKRIDLFKQSYPIGLIDGKYDLHFLHYSNQEDAKTKWLRRVELINFDNILVKSRE